MIGFIERCFRDFNLCVNICLWVGESNREKPSLKCPHFCEVSSSVQLLSSHEEGGQRWLTDSERKSRLWPTILMETSDLGVKAKQRLGSVFFFFFCFFLLSRYLTTPCCETAILKGWISSVCDSEVLQEFYATKEGNGKRPPQKCILSNKQFSCG